jgi:hypothetical protein
VKILRKCIKIILMKNNIPPIIHYCWFGGSQLTELAKRCITSWRQYFLNFEIKEWNESNYDVYKIRYISEAYNAKKYAFVSDYARFDILYHLGGVYFDTDVEVIRPFDAIIKDSPFMGMESDGKVNPGCGMGCGAGLDIIKYFIDFYSELNFIEDDGMYNFRTISEYVTKILKEKGLKYTNTLQTLAGFTVYPSEYFAPKSIVDGKIRITGNTYSIHHYDASWVPQNEKVYYKIKRKLCFIFGRNLGTFISFPYFVSINLRNYGLKCGFKIIKKKLLQKLPEWC